MNKKPFKDIEQIIKNAAEAHVPAFDEQAWQRMEVLLDKDKDRKRPAFFWLWLLLPLLITSGLISYFVFTKNDLKDNRQEIADQKSSNSVKDQTNKTNPTVEKINSSNTKETNIEETGLAGLTPGVDNKVNDKKLNDYAPSLNKKNKPVTTLISNTKNTGEELFAKNNLSEKVNGKMKVNIKTALPVSDEENEMTLTEKKISDNTPDKSKKDIKTEEVVVIKVDTENPENKEVKKMIDSVIEKIAKDDRSKNRKSKFYIMVVVGVESNGVKLFSVDKITTRAGLTVGYRLNKHISIQTGFFASSKKYIAGSGDYKTKPGTYWNIVDIKKIDANCRVYEIPLMVRYDFTPVKKTNIFAAAGLSSYIMKKEDYYFYYDRYGAAHQANAYYSGNKNLFSILRLAAGVERKLSRQLSLNISPGVAIPLKGIGEGEVKLYSADLSIGLKFTPQRKK